MDAISNQPARVVPARQVIPVRTGTGGQAGWRVASSSLFKKPEASGLPRPKAWQVVFSIRFAFANLVAQTRNYSYTNR